MRLNLSRIDEKIAKLQEVRRLMASDPEMVKLLAECMTDDEDATQAIPPPNISKPAGAQAFRLVSEKIHTRNGLHQTVAATALGFGDQQFDVNLVYGQMKRAGFEFRSKRPNVSVGIELRKLHERGRIELLQRGSGSTPAIFRNKTEP